MNIPIYRAKKINSNEYIIGYYFYNSNLDEHWITEVSPIQPDDIDYLSIADPNWREYEIDISTLAISFNDMLDNQGNKIFASLSEDGKGGDIAKSKHYTRPVIYRKGMFSLKDGHLLADDNYLDITVIGIQQ